MLLSSKAKTLAAFQGRLHSARVLDQVTFTVARWSDDRQSCIDSVNKALGLDGLIVRSSAANEDTAMESMAGYYESVANVNGTDAFADAVDYVVKSYGASGDPGEDEVLVQPMLSGVVRSGVAFNVDPNTGAPYRVINYEEGSDTSAVTGGKGGATYVHVAGSNRKAPKHLQRVLALLDELEALVPDTPLDIEFAFSDDDESLVLLQARPLVLRKSVGKVEDLHRRLREVEEKVGRGLGPHPFLHGEKTVYGVMPDWNPAEIIGIRPRPLALSLYREMITDAIWAYQRHNYGYKNLRSFPLLLHFHGLPYIDVRVSFNSFIPRDVDGHLADKLVDYYIERLTEAPNLHDKIEFEVVFSCYSLDLPSRLEVLGEAGISVAERDQLAESLRRLTNRVIHKENGLWCADRDKLKTLDARRNQVMEADLDKVSRIYWLLEDCKRYGTLPFAGLARAGFIAVQMLKSMVSVGVMNTSEYDAFMGGLSTESSHMIKDQGTLSRSTFLAKYGHLRPGTYDILSPRYDEAPDLYFDWSAPSQGTKEKEAAAPFALKLEQMRDISELLKEHGLDADVVGLFDFLEAGITLRERAKFLFTRNLSDALSLMGALGEELGFSQDDMSYADVRTFYEMHGSGGDRKALLARSIEQGRKRYEETKQLWLPPLIGGVDELWGFEALASEPNFITQKSIVAPVVSHTDKDKLAGSIVAIPNADPGYDWLFSHPIEGLVTAYGGVNSHMAIRAGELGLPAVIGAGDTLFEKWSSASRLSIDCAGKRVEALS